MNSILAKRVSWKATLQSHAPLILPAAHDALTAKIIERIGFHAYQIGGFALAGTMHGVPDLDLEHFGEKSAMVRKIIHASNLPVLVDGDDGYGDAKNVTRTVQEYEIMGASALFIEDQAAPKRCGHMAKKTVIPIKDMMNKIKAAQAAKSNPDFFILARTDAIEPNGLRDAIKRGKAYLEAGADGIYVEGPTTRKELERVGKNFAGNPLAVSVLEGGGKTPWIAPSELHAMGFNMILYPTSLLFRLTKAISQAARDLLAQEPMDQSAAVNFKEFEEIVGMRHWQEIEKKFPVE